MPEVSVCPNCGTCTCTGTQIVKALDGSLCCSACVQIYNNKLRYQK